MDEIKHKLSALKFNSNGHLSEKKDHEKQDWTAKIEDVEGQIDTVAEAIESLKSEIAETWCN